MQDLSILILFIYLISSEVHKYTMLIKIDNFDVRKLVAGNN